MAYKPSQGIKCQSNPCRITVIVILFNPHLGDKRIHTFTKVISLKVNVMAELDFKLVYYNVAIQHVSLYVTESNLFALR